MKYVVHQKRTWSLTNTDGCQKPDSGIWWVALWEERLDGVDGEGERHDGDRRGPHHDALHPQPHERQEPPECDHDVGIVGAWVKRVTTSLGRIK